MYASDLPASNTAFRQYGSKLIRNPAQRLTKTQFPVKKMVYEGAKKPSVATKLLPIVVKKLAPVVAGIHYGSKLAGSSWFSPRKVE